MSDNPYIEPAHRRFQQLLDEAEGQLLFENQEAPVPDPFRKYRTAEDWGVDPWIAAMLEVSQSLDVLQNQARDVLQDEEQITQALMVVSTKALQARVLYEEMDASDVVLDDQQLANFLERLTAQLDARIAKLREPVDVSTPSEDQDRKQLQPEEPPEPIHFDKEEKVTITPEVVTQMRAREQGQVSTKLVNNTFSPDEELTPGLAFTGPHGSVVAGEGSDGTPPAGDDTGPWTPRWEEDEPITNEQREQWAGSDDPDFMADHQAQILEERGPHKDPGMIQVHEVAPSEAKKSHDFARNEDEELPPIVDLDAAERAHAREVAVLRQTAAGSSAKDLGGRHASPEATDPGGVKDGKH